ncbi:hypothetical protein [Flavobacterium sp.]|uniref:hypothetical protein n=1 Tax=Flavobacterium sp. TaxID=239 RepID=UPI0026291B32|nr:hypothetical protein [Flavobacterium sp.]
MKKLNIILIVFLSLTSLIFAVLNNSNAEDLKTTEVELNSARDSLSMYQGNYNKLNVQYKILENSLEEK